MSGVSEANAPAEKPVVTGVTVNDRDRSVTAHLSDGTSKRVDAPGDSLNSAIEKAAGPVESEPPAGPVESEPAALVPEGASALPSAGTGSSIESGSAEAEAALKAKAAAIEAYIQAGIDKVAAAVGRTEIVTVAGFKAAMEALLRHLHADHPENYL